MAGIPYLKECFEILKTLTGLTGSGSQVDPTAAKGLEMRRQDQTTPPIDFFFTQIKGSPTTVAVQVGDPTASLIYDVEVASAAGCSIGDYFGMFNADDPANNRAYFGTILNIVSNTITLDTPIDHAFKVGDTAACFSRELNVNGATTPQIFSVQVGPNATQSIDITRLMISMYTDTAVDLAKFGDLAKLTKGCVLRRVNGVIHNVYNVKDNGEIANLTFDYEAIAAIGSAQDGAKFRNTFNGDDKHGVVFRLDPGDELQWIVQDDLSALAQFRIIAEGHYVED